MLDEKELQIFVEHLDCAFFVGDREKMLYSNQKARELYGKFDKLDQLERIFTTEQQEGDVLSLAELDEADFTVLYHQSTKTLTGEYHLVDAHIGYYSREKGQIFLELLPKKANPISTLKTILDDLCRPTLAVTSDDKLTMLYGNPPCQDLFDLEEGQGFGELFPALMREEMVHRIKSTLEKEKSCYLQLQLQQKEGDLQWFALDFQRHLLGEEGECLIIVGHSIVNRPILYRQYKKAPLYEGNKITQQIDISSHGVSISFLFECETRYKNKYNHQLNYLLAEKSRFFADKCTQSSEYQRNSQQQRYPGNSHALT